MMCLDEANSTTKRTATASQLSTVTLTSQSSHATPGMSEVNAYFDYLTGRLGNTCTTNSSEMQVSASSNAGCNVSTKRHEAKKKGRELRNIQKQIKHV